MNKNYWLGRLKIPDNADVLFYQNPKFFRSNTFKIETVHKELDDILLIAGKIKMYTITAVANNHHKNKGKRQKVCLVKEYLNS